MFFSWFSKFVTVKCPDGTTRMVYKNVDDIFPFSIKESKATINGNITADDLGGGEAAASFAEKINDKLFLINEQNAGLWMCFRATYVGYTANPCGNSGNLETYIQEIIREHAKNTELCSKLRALVECVREGQMTFEQAKTKFRESMRFDIGMLSVDDVADEIAKARTAADELSRSSE